MFVNKIKIRLDSLSGKTESYINIPLVQDIDLVGKSELIEDVFVKNETEKSINPIIDYDLVRFVPTTSNNEVLSKIRYVLDFSGNTTYGSIGFSDDDIKFERNVFTNSFLNLNFYDSDNPLEQNLLTFSTIYCGLDQTDLIQANGSIGLGIPKPANDISLTFDLDNPVINPKGLSEGYHLYYLKSSLNIGESKELFMRASFKNAKTGKSTNMMNSNSILPIDQVLSQLYTKYVLYRTETGYYYKIDTSYSSNVSTTQLSTNINLYQIQVS